MTTNDQSVSTEPQATEDELGATVQFRVVVRGQGGFILPDDPAAPIPPAEPPAEPGC